MGQNQDKIEDGEQMPGEELVGQSNEFEKIHHTSEIIEGRSSSDEEAANSEEKLGEEETLYFGQSQMSTTPDDENSINLWKSPSTFEEVRVGGARAERGRRRVLHVYETNQNPKSHMSRTCTHLDQIKKPNQGQVSADTVMEQRTEGTGPNEEDSCGTGVSIGLSEENSCVMKKRRGPSAAISEVTLSHHLDQMNIMEVEAREEDDITHSGTVQHFRGRKEPAAAKPQHPLKNRAQKCPLPDMSLTIHSNQPKEVTTSTTKSKTVLFNEGNDLGEEEINYSIKRNIGNGCHTGSLKSYSGAAPAEQTESLCLDTTDQNSSILEKLLKRNKTDATPSLSKIKEVATDNMPALNSMDYCTAAHHSRDKPSETNHAALTTEQHLNRNQRQTDDYHTTGGHQPAGGENTPDSLKPHLNDVTTRLNTMQTLDNTKTMPKSHEKKACSVHFVNDDALESRTPTVDAGLSIVKEEEKKVKVQPSQSPKAKDDSVIVRHKPKSALKPRPVSELIKESIQIHEKLVQQERSNQAELKASEHGQSVIVAQMKAAFDSAQKSPEKTIVRKTSMRKGQ